MQTGKSTSTDTGSNLENLGKMYGNPMPFTAVRYPYENFMFRPQGHDSASNLHREIAQFTYWRNSFMTCATHKCMMYSQCGNVPRPPACMCNAACCRPQPYMTPVSNMASSYVSSNEVSSSTKTHESTTVSNPWSSDCPKYDSGFINDMSAPVNYTSVNMQFPENLVKDSTQKDSKQASWEMESDKTKATDFTGPVCNTDPCPETKDVHLDSSIFHSLHQIDPNTGNYTSLIPSANLETKAIQCDMR